MQITFMGAARTVTGSFHLVDMDGVRFGVDCGMFQGSKAIKENNYREFEVSPASIDFLILTHAHIDHCGLIPKLVNRGFSGPIYCTQPTRDLLPFMLLDSDHIQEAEVERKNRKAMRAGKPLIQPIYNSDDASKAASLAVVLDYDKTVELAPGVRVCLRDAGHILGSAIAEIWLTENGHETKLVFSGDLGQMNQPIIKDPTFIEDADYVIIESTYGNRFHRQGEGRSKELAKVVREAMDRGGNLIIPSFALERTQDLLYDLYNLFETGQLDPAIDIFIDSPLAVTATEIFQKNTQFYDEESKEILDRGGHPLQLPNLKFSKTAEDSMELNERLGNTIIISASGMCDAGRIKHHLKHNLWREESTILFVGYQSVGTLGRAIVDGATQVKLFGEPVDVRAEIVKVVGLSGHADRDGLLYWLDGFTEKPRRVFVVHGEDTVAAGFAELIGRTRGLEANAPYSGTTFDPIGNRFVYEAAPVPAKKKAKRAVSDVFERLKAAGARLIAVIGRNEGLSNKDLAKFADQVTALCDKWDTKRDTRKG